MIYPFDLYTVGLAVGALLVVLHGVALVQADGIRKFLQRFPRSREMGGVLLAVDAVWAFALVARMDLGEFSLYRPVFLTVIAVGFFLVLAFVEEFLAVRALGMFLLLAAEPLLEAAFLRPEASRLLLSVLAYAWATLGIFWVGKPYLLRDQIAWVTKSDLRWRIAALAGVVYGAAVLVAALTQWGN